MTALRVLDTFSGIGGFSLAARWLGGFETVQFVERDPYCQRILRKHWPTVPIHDDICTFQPRPGSADVVVGGFPCQDISTAGKQAGIKEGTRSGLFYELMRVVRMVGPRYIVLENVAAIASNGLDTVLGVLAEAGFDAEWACIPASDLGACHRRDRWWCVAYAPHLLSNGQPAGHGGEPGRRSVPESGDGDGAGIAPHPHHQRQQEQHPAAITGGTGWPCWGDAPRRLNSDWRSYLSEPVICRRNDGFSAILDSVGRLISESRNPQSLAAADQLGREVLRELWRRICIAEAPFQLRQDRGSDPLSEVPYGHPHERWDMGQRRRAVLGGLRDLWQHISQETVSADSDLFTYLSFRAAAPEVVEAMGRGQRMDRLRALGNAVVPQVAMVPLSRLLQLELCQ